MDGKICLVTGGTSGIGLETASELARLGATVIIIGRKKDKCQDTVQKIILESGNQSVTYLLADLSSQEQIHSVADQFLGMFNHLDVLVNNAGGFFLRRKTSLDGIEMTMALNHIAYYLLTKLLLEALCSSKAARVVNVSSGSHWNRSIDFNDLQMEKSYHPIEAYGRSKLMNILFSNELARQLVNSRITSNALTPGTVATEIWKKVNPFLTPFLYPTIKLIGKNVKEGAQTSVYLASSPEVEGITGKYFADCRMANADPATNDIAVGKELWRVSAELVNGKAG